MSICVCVSKRACSKENVLEFLQMFLFLYIYCLYTRVIFFSGTSAGDFWPIPEAYSKPNFFMASKGWAKVMKQMFLFLI